MIRGAWREISRDGKKDKEDADSIDEFAAAFNNARLNHTRMIRSGMKGRNRLRRGSSGSNLRAFASFR